MVSTKNDWNEITDELGQRFEISFNTYKPFACGIVIHPSIDACVQLREQGVKADDVERIELKVHSLVLELTGKKEPADGLQAKFSVYHGCAVGLIFGRAGEPEYDDAIVTRDDVVALRRKVVATVDDAIDEAVGRRHRGAARRTPRARVRRARDRLAAAADERRRAGSEVRRAVRADPGCCAHGGLDRRVPQDRRVVRCARDAGARQAARALTESRRAFMTSARPC